MDHFIPLAASSAPARRKPYRKPHLEPLGDLRSLTLGGSIGAGESGGVPRKVKTGMPQSGEGVFFPDGSVLLPDGSVRLPDGSIIHPAQ